MFIVQLACDEDLFPNEDFFENAEELLSEGKSVELRCTGSSMRPYLRGDGREVIVVSPFLPEELIRGVIVMFRYNGKLICHRIVNRNGDRLTIQGDGIIKSQEHILTSDVIGVVRTIIRSGKICSTQSKTAQCYWCIWLCLTPIRNRLLLPYKVVAKVKRQLKK